MLTGPPPKFHGTWDILENYFTLAEDEVMDATRGHLKQGAQTTPPVTFSNRTGT
jgi:hypothetical protein